MNGLDLTKEFRDYYLKFNLPLQIVAVIAAIFLSFDITKVLFLTVVFHVLIYWVGIQCGSHKLFSHKSWIPKYKWVTYAIGVISCFGLMGGPILWSLMHRWHHAHSDTDSDPHSPKHGLLHSYFIWFLNIPHVPLRIIKDHILDYNLIRIDKNCKKIVVITLLFLTLLDYEIALSLLFAMVITFHLEMSVNCFAHKQLDGEWKSVNYISLAFITGGSTLHANHHADSSNWNFSKKWYEFDPSAWIIKCLKK